MQVISCQRSRHYHRCSGRRRSELQRASRRCFSHAQPARVLVPLRRTVSSLTAPSKRLKVVLPPSPVLHRSLPATSPPLTKPAAVAPRDSERILPRRKHMVRLDPLRPCGQSCRSSTTAARSSGCLWTAATAPLFVVPLVVEAPYEVDTQVERQVVKEMKSWAWA